jgi:LuxR family maltose regulon positive regulatory protein
MRADAELGGQGLADASPLQGSAFFLEGLADLLDGESDAADAAFARAAEAGRRTGWFPIVAPALAERAVIAIENHDRPAAAALADEALTIIETHNLDDYLESMIVYAVAAHTATDRGDIAAAKDFVTRASRLRPLCTYAAPFSAQFLIQLASAHLGLADAAGARAVLRQVRDILAKRPDLGRVPEHAARLQAMTDAVTEASFGGSSLSVAELRLLPYLTTHLTLREIADRMHVSRNTIKSHSLSIYRKLGVSSRNAAIRCAQETGLLGGPPQNASSRREDAAPTNRV